MCMELTISLILGFFALFVIFLEFFLPGGIMAAMGCALAMGSVVFAMAYDMKFGLIALVLEGFVCTIMIWFALKILKKSHIVLDNDNEVEEK